MTPAKLRVMRMLAVAALVASGIAPTGAATTGPQLVFTDLAAPPRVVAGEPFDVSISVRNDGDQWASELIDILVGGVRVTSGGFACAAGVAFTGEVSASIDTWGTHELEAVMSNGQRIGPLIIEVLPPPPVIASIGNVTASAIVPASVGLSVEDAADVRQLVVRVDFDPEVVRVEAVRLGEVPRGYMAHHVDQDEGWLVIVAHPYGYVDDFTLAEIDVVAQAPGTATSELDVSLVEVKDASWKRLHAVDVDGWFQSDLAPAPRDLTRPLGW